MTITNFTAGKSISLYYNEFEKMMETGGADEVMRRAFAEDAAVLPNIATEIFEISAALADKLNHPKVGIFWYNKGILIKNCTRADEAEVINGFSDLNTSHYKYWNKVCSDHPELRTYEYEEIPRGRVVMKADGPIFIVYSSKKMIRDEKFKDKLIKGFSLPIENTKFISDLHYESPNAINWDD